MSGFGSALMARARRIAAQAAERTGEAMVAAAEAELPPGVSIRREDGVVLRGRGLLARYWGTARRVPDSRVRLFVAMLIGRGA